MKKWYQSKEILFSILFVLVALAEAFGYSDFIPSDEWKELAMIIPIIVNLFWRVFFTHKRIEKSLL